VSSHIAHIAVTRTAQLHYYGCLVTAGILGLLFLIACFGIADTVHRRSRRDLTAAIMSNAGVALVALAYFHNAFVPLKPGKISNLLVPTTEPVGVTLFLAGFCVIVLGLFLTPTGKKGMWLPQHKPHRNTAQQDVWPPPPAEGDSEN